MKFSKKILFTIIILILIITHLAWDYFNEGVPVHFLLAEADLPGISNWWGLLTIPTLTWISLSLIFNKLESQPKAARNKVVYGFLLSLIFGILLSVMWVYDLEHIMQYVILTPIVLSVVVKVHRPECLLGFVLGMVYTFGGVLPIGIGLILMALSFIVYLIFNRGFIYLLSKVR